MDDALPGTAWIRAKAEISSGAPSYGAVVTTVRAGAERFRWIGLDASDRFTELTGGITVVLTVLVGTSFFADDVDDPRDVLVGLAVVAALAAGLSGGVMNVVEDLYEDAQDRHDELAITSATPQEQLALVQELLADELDVQVDEEVAGRLVAAITAEPPRPVRVRAVNLRDVVASLLLNAVPLVPVVLAFWLIDDWRTALLVADLLLVAALFAVGYVYGFRLRFAPLVCGSVMLGVGLVLVAISTLSDSL